MLMHRLQARARNFAIPLIFSRTFPTRLKSLRASSKGQAVVELALALPILVLLIAYTLNAYLMMHTSHVGQRYAAMNLMARANHRAQLVFDDVDGREVSRGFMAAQALDEDGQAPRRRIVLNDREIVSIMGICREPSRQRCR
jgi:hypothetical protein